MPGRPAAGGRKPTRHWDGGLPIAGGDVPPRGVDDSCQVKLRRVKPRERTRLKYTGEVVVGARPRSP